MMRHHFLHPKHRKHASSFCDGLQADAAVRLLRTSAKALSHFNDGDSDPEEHGPSPAKWQPFQNESRNRRERLEN
jgi:hypothetical protein